MSNLRENRIDSIAFFKMLSYNTGIVELDLDEVLIRGNELDGLIGHILSNLLTVNTTLTYLNLAGNAINDDEVGTFVNSLASNQTLRILDLSS
jgi:hypothetical protein